jgi:[acyl-carrier-protein] S-malonyltransferase
VIENKQLALLFPGQGSQEPGMGKDLAEFWSDAMDLWKLGEKISGFPLREIFWDGEAKDMAQTKYLQPALTIVNLSLWFFIQDKVSPSPLFMTGHSLGEFSALCASKVLSIEDTLKLVSLRGRLMAEADPEGKGKMAAILKLDQELVEKLVQETHQETGQEILVANYNTPAQFVVSGHSESIDLIIKKVKKQKGRSVLLPVSGAFHSPMMEEAAQELAEFMAKLEWNTPRVPVYFNATGQKEIDPAKIKEIMARQMTSSVYWIQIIRAIFSDGGNQFMEIGPKGVLSRMVGQILAEDKDKIEVKSVATLEDTKHEF